MATSSVYNGLSDIAAGAYQSQDLLLKAQKDYAGQFAESEAQVGAQRASAEAKGVQAAYPAYYNALVGSSKEFGTATTGYNNRMKSANSIYDALEEDALSELKLGGQLTGDERRESSQATRAGWASRGLATSGRSAIDEVLNRTSLSDQRKSERRSNAMNVASGGQTIATNNMQTANQVFNPYTNIYGSGGSQSTGKLSSGSIYDSYSGAGSSMYSSNNSYDAALAGYDSAESINDANLGYSTWATKYNANEARYLNTQNVNAAKSASNTSLLGSLFSGATSLLGSGMISSSIGKKSSSGGLLSSLF